MANVHTQVVLKNTTALVEDDVVHTFNFITPTAGAPSALELSQITGALVEFYNVDTSGGTNTAEQISRCISRASTACEVRHFNVTAVLDGSPAGSPVAIHVFTLGAAAASSAPGLPSEVATCLSYHSDYTDRPEVGPLHTRPRARERGRIYIGPLASSLLSERTPNTPVPANFWIDHLALAATRLKDNPNTEWAVWSRKEARMEAVVGGWVDDAFDIQRRRGETAVQRALWS